ncbi:MAG: hypothetical protein Q7S36_00440 [Candidatus Liptonbacteria bacterium]|nr:hypothetical protein [Candidatus Liptonbacteria bacterium]
MPLATGNYYAYRKNGRRNIKRVPVFVTKGHFLGGYGRVSNFWYWRQIGPHGELGAESNGYDNVHGAFEPITEKEAIELARREVR